MNGKKARALRKLAGTKGRETEYTIEPSTRRYRPNPSGQGAGIHTATIILAQGTARHYLKTLKRELGHG